jgi:transposase
LWPRCRTTDASGETSGPSARSAFCAKPTPARSVERGAFGALLRREGLYSSQLNDWRAHRTLEGQAGLQPKRPGPKPSHDAKDSLIEKQNARIEKLEKELRISKALLELQGKAHEILGLALPRVDDKRTDRRACPSAPPRGPDEPRLRSCWRQSGNSLSALAARAANSGTLATAHRGRGTR